MYVWTLSSLILFVALGAMLSFRHQGMIDVSDSSQLEISSMSGNDVKDTLILEDLPPPDDTYTPEQRRYS